MNPFTLRQFTCTFFLCTKKLGSGLAEKFVALFFLFIAANTLPSVAQNGYPSLTFHSPVYSNQVNHSAVNQVNRTCILLPQSHLQMIVPILTGK